MKNENYLSYEEIASLLNKEENTKSITPSYNYSTLIENDNTNLKSIYFGQTLNENVLEFYLMQADEIKNKLNYLQFEKIFIMFVILKTKPIDRQTLISYLNNEIVSACKSILKSLTEENIQYFLNNEINNTKKLEKYKL